MNQIKRIIKLSHAFGPSGFEDDVVVPARKEAAAFL